MFQDFGLRLSLKLRFRISWHDALLYTYYLVWDSALCIVLNLALNLVSDSVSDLELSFKAFTLVLYLALYLDSDWASNLFLDSVWEWVLNLVWDFELSLRLWT